VAAKSNPVKPQAIAPTNRLSGRTYRANATNSAQDKSARPASAPPPGPSSLTPSIAVAATASSAPSSGARRAAPSVRPKRLKEAAVSQ
jgi:hypothetical protein